MLFSIIIPTYNAPEFFYECLASAAAQTLDAGDYEIIVVLNGDREPFYHQVEQYIESHGINNARVVFSEPKGVSHARNMGMSLARGDYIVFVDDDDRISTGYLKGMHPLCDASRIVVSNVICFNAEERTSGDYLTRHFAKHQNEHNIFQNRKYFSVVWAKCIPRNVIDGALFDPTFPPIEDVLFMALISRKVRAVVKAGEDAVYQRRLRPGSASEKKYAIMRPLKLRIRIIGAIGAMLFQRGYSELFVLSRIAAAIRAAIWDVRNFFKANP